MARRRTKRCRCRNPKRRTYHTRHRRLHKSFWGVEPQGAIRLPIPGKRNRVVVNLGRSPAVNLADGPKGKAKNIRRKRHSGRLLVGNASGTQMAIINLRRGIPRRPRLSFAGYAAATEYIPPKQVEKAGSFKKGRHWIHKHHDERGRWPKVFKDQFGNYYYTKSSYRIKKWIRR